MEQPLSEIIRKIISDQIHKKVNEYMTDARTWDWENLERILHAEILLHIVAFRISNASMEPDDITWNKTSSGMFSSKSAFEMMNQPLARPPDPMLMQIGK